MANWKKLASGAAGAAGGAGLNVEDVFSTYLYDGTGATRSITNGIDLAGEGGMTWIKLRNSASNNELYDTERGATYSICSNTSNVAITRSTGLTSFNSNGFTVGSGTNVNANNYDVASWTFRKAPKFFDVVTYTGNGTSGRQIAHNLGSVPGMIFTKALGIQYDWGVYHRSVGNTKAMQLNTDYTPNTGSSFWNNTTPTSTHFTVGADNATNDNNREYVAYIFAHNNNDGGFGATGDQDIIKCGTYTAANADFGLRDINIGFEPQWVLIKNITSAQYWTILDVWRGWPNTWSDSQPRALYPNNSFAEENVGMYSNWPYANGMHFTSGSAKIASGGHTYVYMAIRRPMGVPTTRSELFEVQLGDSSGAPEYDGLDFNVDMAINPWLTNGDTATYYPTLSARALHGAYLQTANVQSADASTNFHFDYEGAWYNGSQYNQIISYMWRRATGYFETVNYIGTGSTNNVPHNLGVVPEMIWTKNVKDNYGWAVYHKDLSVGSTPANSCFMRLDSSGGAQDGSGDDYWGATSPTATQFTVRSDNTTNRGAGDPPYMAFLFASLSGISKVGSYTGNGSSGQNIDCGFSNSARFVLIKRYDSSGRWNVYDTVRGIVAGSDYRIALDDNSSQTTNVDRVDPYSGGFSVVYTSGGGDDPNINGAKYIFYAIAA